MFLDLPSSKFAFPLCLVITPISHDWVSATYHLMLVRHCHGKRSHVTIVGRNTKRKNARQSFDHTLCFMNLPIAKRVFYTESKTKFGKPNVILSTLSGPQTAGMVKMCSSIRRFEWTVGGMMSRTQQLCSLKNHLDHMSITMPPSSNCWV